MVIKSVNVAEYTFNIKMLLRKQGLILIAYSLALSLEITSRLKY